MCSVAIILYLKVEILSLSCDSNTQQQQQKKAYFVSCKLATPREEAAAHLQLLLMLLIETKLYPISPDCYKYF